MKDASAFDPASDDIGAMIDELLADPARADLVKARLRARLVRSSTPQAAPAAETDGEDLWDNCPI